MCANASPIDSRAIAMAWRAVLDLAKQPPTVAEREGSTQMEVGVGGSRPLTRNYVANVLHWNADIFGKAVGGQTQGFEELLGQHFASGNRCNCRHRQTSSAGSQRCLRLWTFARVDTTQTRAMHR